MESETHVKNPGFSACVGSYDASRARTARSGMSSSSRDRFLLFRGVEVTSVATTVSSVSATEGGGRLELGMGASLMPALVAAPLRTPLSWVSDLENM